MSTEARNEFLKCVFGIEHPEDFSGADYLLDLTFEGNFLTKEEYQLHANDPDALIDIWDARMLAHLQQTCGLELANSCVKIDEVSKRFQDLHK